MDCHPPQRCDGPLVRHAIGQLRTYHLAQPFALLRERAVQAALKRYLDAALEPHDSLVRACIYSRVNQPATAPGGSPDWWVMTERVRLEARMCSAAVWALQSPTPGMPQAQPDSVVGTAPAKEVKKVVDIAVFRSTTGPKTAAVRLQNYGHGLGDISAATHEDDVSCLLEIKASPTHNKQEAAKFGHDIGYLLGVCARHPQVQGFFVCLDKTSAFYGDYRLGGKALPTAHLNWSLCHGQPSGMPLLAVLQQSFARSADQHLHVESLKDIWISQSAPASGPYVEVFDISAKASAPWQYYAYRHPSAT